jgi:hypothetical protein
LRFFYLIPASENATIIMEGTEAIKEDGDSLLIISADYCAERIIWVETDYEMWNDSKNETN